MQMRVFRALQRYAVACHPIRRNAIPATAKRRLTMRSLMKLAACAALVSSLGACATTDLMLSDNRIASNTAGAIGVQPGDLTITDRRTELTNTYYVATTSTGARYACVINGGGALAMGLVNPPSCQLAPAQ